MFVKRRLSQPPEFRTGRTLSELLNDSRGLRIHEIPWKTETQKIKAKINRAIPALHPPCLNEPSAAIWRGETDTWGQYLGQERAKKKKSSARSWWKTYGAKINRTKRYRSTIRSLPVVAKYTVKAVATGECGVCVVLCLCGEFQIAIVSVNRNCTSIGTTNITFEISSGVPQIMDTIGLYSESSFSGAESLNVWADWPEKSQGSVPGTLFSPNG